MPRLIDSPACCHHHPGMNEQTPTLTTIGYEGSLLDDFIATLEASSVRLLIDVRQLPISRRKGFAKGALSTALDAAGIGYLHLKGLGDPKPGRDAARSGDHDLFLKVFSAHMLTFGAQAHLSVAIERAAAGGACLMCYERDHSSCHRKLVAEAIHAKTAIRIRNLGVRSGLAAANRTPSTSPPNVWA